MLFVPLEPSNGNYACAFQFYRYRYIGTYNNFYSVILSAAKPLLPVVVQGKIDGDAELFEKESIRHGLLYSLLIEMG